MPAGLGKKKGPKPDSGIKDQTNSMACIGKILEQLHLLNYFNLFNYVLLRKLSRLLKWWWKVMSMEGEGGKKRVRNY